MRLHLAETEVIWLETLHTVPAISCLPGVEANILIGRHRQPNATPGDISHPPPFSLAFIPDLQMLRWSTLLSRGMLDCILYAGFSGSVQIYDRVFKSRSIRLGSVKFEVESSLSLYTEQSILAKKTLSSSTRIASDIP